MSVWRKLHYFFSMLGPVLWIDDEIEKLEEAIQIMREMLKNERKI